MNTWALSDEAESCDFQLRILKKRTGLGSHPSSPKTIVLQAILEHVRSSEVTCYQWALGVRIPLVHQFFNQDEDRQQPKNVAWFATRYPTGLLGNQRNFTCSVSA